MVAADGQGVAVADGLAEGDVFVELLGVDDAVEPDVHPAATIRDAKTKEMLRRDRRTWCIGCSVIVTSPEPWGSAKPGLALPAYPDP